MRPAGLEALYLAEELLPGSQFLRRRNILSEE
jgi:hypothetical protein